MRLIRNNIFETNSSSTHALVVYKNGKYILPDKLRFDIGEFGWSYNVYYDTHSKASYIITLIFTHNTRYETEYLLDKLGRILDKNNIQYSFPEVNFINEYGWGYWDIDGYVDHSCEAYSWLYDILDDEDMLFKFLFNNESYISTGNDNDDSYYIPGIGSYHDYYDSDYNIKPSWGEKIDELENNGYDIYFKGN